MKAILMLLVLAAFAMTHEARAHHKGDVCYQCTTNHITEVTEVVDVTTWRITDAISASAMVEIIASGMSHGAHQFDYVTTRWQLSITGTTVTSDWDEETQFSFAIAKRFGKDHWMPNALWHLTYTPDILEDDYVTVGATVPLGGE